MWINNMLYGKIKQNNGTESSWRDGLGELFYMCWSGKNSWMRWQQSWDWKETWKNIIRGKGSQVMIMATPSSISTWLAAKQTSFYRGDGDKRSSDSGKAKRKFTSLIQQDNKNQARAQDSEGQFKSPNVIWLQGSNIWPVTSFLFFFFIFFPFLFPSIPSFYF